VVVVLDVEEVPVKRLLKLKVLIDSSLYRRIPEKVK
jgi:hypothetical protein